MVVCSVKFFFGVVVVFGIVVVVGVACGLVVVRGAGFVCVVVGVVVQKNEKKMKRRKR